MSKVLKASTVAAKVKSAETVPCSCSIPSDVCSLARSHEILRSKCEKMEELRNQLSLAEEAVEIYYTENSRLEIKCGEQEKRARVAEEKVNILLNIVVDYHKCLLAGLIPPKDCRGNGECSECIHEFLEKEVALRFEQDGKTLAEVYGDPDMQYGQMPADSLL